MKNLIPKWIQTQYRNKIFEGNFLALTMFIDISGFTQMTETLMKKGDEGAEILSSILNKIFNPLVNVIHKRGGFISTFAGDAFTSVFPLQSIPDDLTIQSLRVAYSATQIQTIFKNEGMQQTKFGDFELKVKVGLSYGDVSWGIVGKTDKAYFFRGEAIDGCAYSEHHAEKGDIIFDSAFQKVLRPNAVGSETVTENYYRLTQVYDYQTARKLPQVASEPRLIKQVVRDFIPESVIAFTQLGEFRNVVSVFISFEGLTEKSELDGFVSILLEHVNRFSGYFNKIDFGDKGGVVLCLFGAPIAFENNVERALDFILAVKRDINQAITLKNLNLRAGITYGMVYAGIVGGQKRCEYTALGDVVNLSARFMMKADWGDIWVTDHIHRTTEQGYHYEFLGEFRFKGKSQEIPAYRLTGKKEAVQEIFTGKFVGRSNELEEVQQQFGLIKTDRFGGLIYIYGEAGVGKSRFVFELKKQNDDVKWLYLPCDGVLQKSFNMYTYFLNNFFEQSPDNPLVQNRANFTRIYNNLIVESPDFAAELTRLQSIVEGFLGIHDLSENSLFNQLDAQLRYENTLHAFAEIFRALSNQQPLVIEIEDLQWMDVDSMQAMQVLARNVESYPIVIVVTSRYNDDHSKPTLAVNLPTIEIDLQTLSTEGMVELAESILNGTISEKLKGNLVGKTRGNPFFVEQTISYYQEMDLISYDEIWNLTGEEGAIPDTITDLLIARIDRLSARLKEAVQTASVIGNEFDLNLLLDVLKRSVGMWRQRDVEMFLEKGQDSKIWALLSEIKGIFAHAMMRDVAYLMQLKSRLRHLHKIIANTIEISFPDNPRFFADLAYHYLKAEDKEKAIEYAEKAGDVAKDNFQNQTALNFYDQWVELMDEKLGIVGGEVEITDKNRVDVEHYVDVLVYKTSYMLQILGKVDDAIRTVERGLQLAERLDSTEQIGVLKLEWGNLLNVKGEFQQAIEHSKRALALLEDVDNQKMVGLACYNLGLSSWYTGSSQQAVAYFERSLEIWGDLNDQNNLAKSLGAIGIVYDFGGDSKTAMEYYQRQHRIFEQLNHKQGLAEAIGNIGVIYEYAEDYQKALECYQEKLKLCQEIGHRREIAIALANMGSVYHEMDQYDQAMIYYQRALNLSQELDDKAGIAGILANIAHTDKAQGKYSEALNYYQQGIEYAEKHQIKYILPEYFIEKADLLFLQGQFEEAKNLALRGLEIAKFIDNADYVHKGEQLLMKINGAIE